MVHSPNVTTAWTGLCQSQEPRTPSLTPKWVAQIQILELSSDASQDTHFQEVESEFEAGLKLRHSITGCGHPSQCHNILYQNASPYVFFFSFFKLSFWTWLPWSEEWPSTLYHNAIPCCFLFSFFKLSFWT